MTNNISTTPDRIFIKPGVNRDPSTAPVNYKNNFDGDYYFDSLEKKVSYLGKFFY